MRGYEKAMLAVLSQRYARKYETTKVLDQQWQAKVGRKSWRSVDWGGFTTCDLVAFERRELGHAISAASGLGDTRPIPGAPGMWPESTPCGFRPLLVAEIWILVGAWDPAMAQTKTVHDPLSHETTQQRPPSPDSAVDERAAERAATAAAGQVVARRGRCPTKHLQ